MTDLAGWPALVLTAGLATRLRPLSTVRAKAAMPVAGTPLIARILGWLRAAGVRRVVLNLHHRPETITRVVGDGSPWDVDVRYSWEPRILGSAGGPRRALPLLDAERFLIVNGDTLTNCDLRALAGRHLESRALVTMAVVPGDVARYGGAVVDADGYITGFARATRTASPALPASPAPPAAVFHFIGAQAVESRTFRDLPDGMPSETVLSLYPGLIAASPRSVAAFQSTAEFLDVGTAHDYLDTVALIAAREQRPFDRGSDVSIAADAQIEDTAIWDRVTIGRGVRLRRCVVADDVAILDGTSLEGQVIVATPAGVELAPLR
jgi:mannose-1-phosphate guanylyltransferase